MSSMVYYAPSYKHESLGIGGNTLTMNKKKVKNFSYSISDRIGKGFSAVVYKGINETTKETVAIKCIEMKGVNKDSVGKEMLDCEIQALTTLKHPNVLQCFDVSKQAASCYIITEFCNQGDLSALLKKKRRLSEKDATKLLKDIVAGFIEIGDKGFLHRDLKLANIFINNGNAKIADFGFAKKNKNSFQKEKYNVGSPLYMSPEALKKNIYSLKNDIWSIGIMAYQLLHGETPWDCRTEKELMEKMIRVPLKFKDSLNLSPEIKNFIKKCLEVDENRRMSLNDLKSWDFATGCITTQQRISLPSKMALKQKQISAVQNLNPLNELTNRPSARTQRTNSTHQGNKQNRQSSQQQNNVLPKSIVDRNNGLILNEINLFRLLFKLVQKLKKTYPNEKDILQMISNEAVRKVSNLKRCCVDNQNIDSFDLKEAQYYLSEAKNPSIKKYKSVISEYFRKYTAELKTAPVGKTLVLADAIRGFLKKLSAVGVSPQEDCTMLYWMIEYVILPREPKKEHLDGILDPKIQISKQYIAERLKEIS